MPNGDNPNETPHTEPTSPEPNARANLIPSLTRQDVDWNNGPLYEVGLKVLRGIEESPAEKKIFQKGNQLVRVRDTDEGGQIEILNLDSLRHHIDQRIRFVEGRGKGGPRPGPPPYDYIRDIMAMPSWPEKAFPKLVGISHIPFFRPDGTLVTKPGYDAATKIMYDPSSDLLNMVIPENPTQDDIRQAAELIKNDLLVDFPFAEEADFANATAFLITPFVMVLSGGRIPMLIVDAPVQGTGKGLLINVLAVIATGGEVSATPESKSEEETRKLITALLVEGRIWILWDNLTGRLRSSALAGLLTAPKWSDRKLSESTMLSLTCRSILSGTANHLEVDADLARRIVWVLLDARMEYPDARTPDHFKHPDIIEWAKAHRIEIIKAVLTLGRAWVLQGRPPGTQPMGSFESWARTLGGILSVAGINGFLSNASKHRESRDEDTSDLRRLTEVWWGKHENGEVGVKDIFVIVEEEEILPHVMAADSSTAQRQRLGKLLSKNQNRHFGPYRLCGAKSDHCGRRMYCLEIAPKAPAKTIKPTKPTSVEPRYGEPGYPTEEQQRRWSKLLRHDSDDDDSVTKSFNEDASEVGGGFVGYDEEFEDDEGDDGLIA